MNKNPYDVIKSRYVTEKSGVLSGLHKAKSNRSLARCENPKVTFLVDCDANKHEIANALEEIYQRNSIKVVAVNTMNVKPKQYPRRGQRNPGRDVAVKKAIVTLSPNDTIED